MADIAVGVDVVPGQMFEAPARRASLIQSEHYLNPRVTSDTPIGREEEYHDHQYLYLDVTLESGPAPSLDSLTFRFDGATYAPLDPIPDNQFILFREWLQNGDPRYQGVANDTERGWVVFELPETGDAHDARLEWPGGGWHPNEETRSRLAAPLPRLSLEEWRVSDTVPVYSHMAFGFTVRNHGTHIGQFVAGINGRGWHGGDHHPVALISHAIPPGTTESWDVMGEKILHPHADGVGDGQPDITYELVWPNSRHERDVRVVEA